MGDSLYQITLSFSLSFSYFGGPSEFRKHNVFCCSVNLRPTLLVKQPSEAHVPLFKPLSLIRVSLQAALSTHINSAMYSQDETIRLADSEKTELFWILLMKLGASPLLSKLGQPFTQKNYALTQRLQAYLSQIFEIRKEKLLKNPRENCCQPRKLNEAMFLENVH